MTLKMSKARELLADPALPCSDRYGQLVEWTAVWVSFHDGPMLHVSSVMPGGVTPAERAKRIEVTHGRSIDEMERWDFPPTSDGLADAIDKYKELVELYEHKTEF